MKAVILAIGDELVLGQNVDTNSAWISARLVERGIFTVFHKTVPDDQPAIVAAIREAAELADVVIVTGGLGPTADDLTRQALAEVMQAPLELHAPSLEKMKGFFRKLGRPMPDTNSIQAMCPRGAEILENDFGTAPGLKARLGRATVLIFPGVPKEMKGMFDRHALPALPGQSGRTILTAIVNAFGAGESVVAEKLGELMRRDRNPLVGTTVSAGIIAVRIRSDFESVERARQALAETVQAVEERLGDLVFSRGDVTLPQVVGERLRQKGRSVVTVESCTGGLLAKLFTDGAGSSDYFRGGWVVYANDMKQGQLQVPAAMLDAYGAVSEPVARTMAEQGLAAGRADYALAVTGVAGPSGGSAEKPVGTVWLALAVRRGPEVQVQAERFSFPGDREMVRDRSAKMALDMLRLELLRG
jgi:nicotinamide-nucleotide amidase